MELQNASLNCTGLEVKTCQSPIWGGVLFRVEAEEVIIERVGHRDTFYKGVP